MRIPFFQRQSRRRLRVLTRIHLRGQGGSAQGAHGQTTTADSDDETRLRISARRPGRWEQASCSMTGLKQRFQNIISGRHRFHRWMAASFLLLFAGWAHAQATVYTAASTGSYTSKSDYTACALGPCQNFTLAMGVSGSFTTASPLAGNLAGTSIPGLVTSFSFTDGVTTYSSSDPSSRIYMFQVTTNAAGAITDTTILLSRWETGGSPHALNDRSSLTMVSNTSQTGHNYLCDTIATSPAGVADTCDNEVTDSGTSAAAGARVSWSSVTTASTPQAIPTLSQWGLIIVSTILGLAALVTMRRKAVSFFGSRS